MSPRKNSLPMPSSDDLDKGKRSVSTPKSVRRLRILSERSPTNNRRDSSAEPCTPVFSPINRKYATATPHPEIRRSQRNSHTKSASPHHEIRRSQRNSLIKSGMLQNALPINGSGLKFKGNRIIPKIFVDGPIATNSQSYVTANSSQVFQDLGEVNHKVPKIFKDEPMNLSTSLCNMQNFVTADTTEAFLELDDVNPSTPENESNKRKFEELELRIDALQGKADQDQTEKFRENFKELEGQIERMERKIQELENSQQLAENMLTNATRRMDFLESQLKPIQKGKIIRKKRTSSLSDLQQTYDLQQTNDETELSRNRTRLGRQKLPKVEKRPTTVPQPFSFAAREERRAQAKRAKPS